MPALAEWLTAKRVTASDTLGGEKFARRIEEKTLIF
jgi:hypothetical protein